MAQEASTSSNAPPESNLSPSKDHGADVTGDNNSGGSNNDIYQHSNYVYILDPDHSWIPAQITDRKPDNQIIHLSVPQYKTEQAIQCDGGRTAKSFKKMEINVNDPKTSKMMDGQAHLPLQNVNNQGELQVVEDMVDLPFLHEVSKSKGVECVSPKAIVFA